MALDKFFLRIKCFFNFFVNFYGTSSMPTRVLAPKLSPTNSVCERKLPLEASLNQP